MAKSMSDKAQAEAEVFERLKTELAHAFAEPDDAYQVLDADAVIRRNSSQPRP